MALATEEEWENDPELRAMRLEFVTSFLERRQKLEAFYPVLRQGVPGEAAYEQALAGIGALVHKLAGAAETYGFPMLTRAGAALEDWLGTSNPRERASKRVLSFVELVAEMLGQAQSTGKDARDFAADPRLQSLESAARDASARLSGDPLE